MKKKKLIRITTVPGSLAILLKGQLKFMTQCFDVIGISSVDKDYLKVIEANEGISTIPVNMTRKITPLKDLIAIYKLYFIFRKEKPFIVHTHTPKAGTLGMIASKLAGVPNRLHTIAGLPLVEVRGPKRLLLNLVEKITYSCANKIYPNSFGLEKIILDNKFTTKEKLKVIGNGSSNGIDTSHYDVNKVSDNEKKHLKKQLGIKSNDFVFIFVGRLVADKGINELINAFEGISKIFTNAKLLLVGPYETHMDPLKGETMEAISTHKNIIAVGWQNDVRPYFAISNVLVFPSYREGFPNVVLQACAMKLPCIVTNINGCNEIISEPYNGIIIPVKNAEAVFNAMEKMYKKSTEEHNLMKEVSRKIIETNFKQQFVWKEILNEYQKLVINN